MILKRSKVAAFVVGLIYRHSPRVTTAAGGGLVVQRSGSADILSLDPETLAKLAALPAPALPTTSNADVQLGPARPLEMPILPVLGPSDL